MQIIALELDSKLGEVLSKLCASSNKTMEDVIWELVHAGLEAGRRERPAHVRKEKK